MSTFLVIGRCYSHMSAAGVVFLWMSSLVASCAGDTAQNTATLDASALIQLQIESDLYHLGEIPPELVEHVGPLPAIRHEPVMTSNTGQRQLMRNSGDVEYISQMTVGGQVVQGILDTGSFELVVFSTACKTCGQASRYDPVRSSSHTEGAFTTVHSYGSGKTTSNEAADFVAMGPLEAKNQTFWEVVDAQMPILREATFQAIIGIGPPESIYTDAWLEVQSTLDVVNEYFNDSTLVPDELAVNAKESIDAAVEISKSKVMLDNFGVHTFSVCMGAVPHSDGYFVWNDTLFREKPDLFTRVPILGRHTWSVSLSNVRLTRPGSFTESRIGCAPETKCSALMDSGTSLLAMPSEVVNEVQRLITQMQGSCSDLEGLPTLVFELGGKMFSLPPDSYILEPEGRVPDELREFVRIRDVSKACNHKNCGSGSDCDCKHGQDAKSDAVGVGACKVLVMESYMDSKDGPVWIMGMPWFRKYYTSFHVGDSYGSRAMYVAEADTNCAPLEGTALARSRTYKRTLDLNRLHPPSAFKDGARSAGVPVRRRRTMSL